MLGTWYTHQQYQDFLIQTLNGIVRKDCGRLDAILEYEDILSKLFLLDLDPMKDLIASLYPSTGSPAHLQPEIVRSFVLMNHLGLSITQMNFKLHTNPVLRTAVGVTRDCIPSVGSHYNFMNRIFSFDDSSKVKSVYRKPSKKFAVNEKMPPKHPNAVAKLVDKILAGESFQRRPERLLQLIFAKCIVEPSAKLGLLGDTMNLDIAGDGTCVASGASHAGTKVCDCLDNHIYRCDCKRKFSDPHASWGWDSHNQKYFYGYMGYFVSCYNKIHKLDLPIYLRLLDGSRHDSISTVVALAELPLLYPDFSFRTFICDSAADNYASYKLLHSMNMDAVIALNPKNQGNSTYPSYLNINEDGVPVCMGGFPMIYWGRDSKSSRIKWRCPLALNRITACDCKCDCSPSDYGRTIYTKPEWDLRLFTTIIRGSLTWKEKMKARTSCERVNNRIMNNYHLEHTKTRGKKRLSFHATFAAFNIHLDAWVKVNHFSILDSLSRRASA